MSDESKRNVQYFEAPSMRVLHELLEAWQIRNKTRFLSVSIEQDGGEFCCIALTNPTEVVIVDGFGSRQASVLDGRLCVGPIPNRGIAMGVSSSE
jgi:hypothetical protein